MDTELVALGESVREACERAEELAERSGALLEQARELRRDSERRRRARGAAHGGGGGVVEASGDGSSGSVT